MLLFADVDAAATSSAVAAGLAALSTLLSGLFSYLNAREKLRADRETAKDKLQFDAERVQMRADIELLKARTDECHQERDRLLADVAELRQVVERRHGDARRPADPEEGS